MLTKCDYCGKKITKPPRDSVHKHAFCNMKCYSAYRVEHPEEYVFKRKYNKDTMNKLLKYAEINKSKRFMNKDKIRNKKEE